MSGETEEQVSGSGWTTDTLREFFLGILAEHDKRYEQRFAAQEKATLAALVAVKEAAALLDSETRQWRAGANEWRSAMDDRERRFLPRAEAAVLDEQNAKAMSGLITRFDTLEKRFNERESTGRGSRATWGYVVGAFGVIVAIIGLASRFLGQ